MHLVLKLMHDDLLFLKRVFLFLFFFFFFEKGWLILLVPEKGDKAKLKAPSLENRCMTLENFDLVNFLFFSFLFGVKYHFHP